MYISSVFMSIFDFYFRCQVVSLAFVLRKIVRRLLGIMTTLNQKKIPWYTLAFMSFSTVWGFGNVVNGFVYFNGIQVIFSWILMFALYFIPYALMVGELGSAFKNSGGGVSSWVHQTMGSKVAYYAGWTYWACHITYIASKSSGGLKALSWAIFRNAETYDTLPTLGVQMATLAKRKNSLLP